MSEKEGRWRVVESPTRVPGSHRDLNSNPLGEIGCLSRAASELGSPWKTSDYREGSPSDSYAEPQNEFVEFYIDAGKVDLHNSCQQFETHGQGRDK